MPGNCCLLFAATFTHRISYVDVCSIWQVSDSRIQVYDVAWQLMLMHVRIDSLNQRGLA
jgi:hypothetical protein